MNSRRSLTAFEHDRLKVDGEALTGRHLEALDGYARRSLRAPYTVERNAVRFSQFVGALRVGKTTIEVLPKALYQPPTGEGGPDTVEIRRRLLRLLTFTGAVYSKTAGDLETRCARQTLFAAWQRVFLNEVELILSRGLVRSYRSHQAELSAVRGKILTHLIATANPAHRERLACRYPIYDRSNALNGLLKQGLQAVLAGATSPQIAERAKAALINFSEVVAPALSRTEIERLQPPRKAAHYQSALTLARMLVLGRSPALRAGSLPVQAIMFDMNQIFERYVAKCFKQAARRHADARVHVQVRAPFWKSRGLRPDLIIEHPQRRIALDTKWKILDHPTPSDSDLKQMYVYARFFDSPDTVLLYPETGVAPAGGSYRDNAASCSVRFMELRPDDGGVAAASRLLTELIGSCTNQDTV